MHKLKYRLGRAGSVKYFAVTSTESILKDGEKKRKVDDNIVVDNKNKRYNRHDGTR
ncbi:hypothetical protein [Agathobacter sp.]